MAILVVLVAIAVVGWMRFGRTTSVAITFDGAVVDQPAQVLRTAEDDLATLAHTRLGVTNRTTHCYFERVARSATAKSSDVAHSLQCGPVLFYDGDPSRPYLAYTLSRSGATGKKAILSVGANPVSAAPSAIPAGATLVRPDRIHAPSGSGGILAPIPPAAALDVLRVVDAVGPQMPHKAPPTAIIGSDNVTLILLSSGWVAHYGSDAGARSAAPGQRLLAFELSLASGENADPNFGKLRIGVSINNGAPRQLPLDHAPALAGAQKFVAAVPTSTTNADLVVTDSGVTQRLSILSGRPNPGNVAVLRRTNRSVRINASGTARAVVSYGGTQSEVQLHVRVDSAYIGYFVPDPKIHPGSPDRAFLEVDLCYTSPDFADPRTCHSFRSTDQTLVLSGGSPVAARDLDPSSNRSNNVFEVPATFSSGVLTIAGSESSTDGWSMTVVAPCQFTINIPR